MPIKAAYDQKWEVERVSLADLLAEKDQDGKPLEDKKIFIQEKGLVIRLKSSKVERQSSRGRAYMQCST
jgi:hypothetical protein